MGLPFSPRRYTIADNTNVSHPFWLDSHSVTARLMVVNVRSYLDLEHRVDTGTSRRSTLVHHFYNFGASLSSTVLQRCLARATLSKTSTVLSFLVSMTS